MTNNNSDQTPRRIALRDQSTILRVPVQNLDAAVVDQTGQAIPQNRAQRRAKMRLIRPEDAELRAKVRPLVEQLRDQPYAVRLEAAGRVRAIAQTTRMSDRTRAWMLERVAELQQPED